MNGNPDIHSPDLLKAASRPESSIARNSFFGLILFVICGLVITAILSGGTPPPAGMAGYFINGQLISVGRHSLDLSKPIFLHGRTPVCGSEDALENFSFDNPGDCTVVNSAAAAGMIGIQANGMREPAFQMQMQTQNGLVKGWVDYNSLHN